MSTTPPAGLRLRPATIDDATAITDVVNASTSAEVGVPWTTVEETRGDLTDPERDAETDLLLVDEAGVVVAYLDMHINEPPRLDMFNLAFVHPDRWGQGISTYLLTLGEERAQARLDGAYGIDRRPLQVARFANVQAAGSLFETLGYHVVRTFWEMEIDLDHDPDPPGTIDGITIRTFDFERELRPLYDTLADGFSDHWGNVLSPFERWRYRMIEAEGSGFDPNLWFVALDGDQIVGAATSRSRSANRKDTAEVDYIAVRPPWRRRGIALALLRTLFGEFRAGGIPRAKLEVDADSATGATQLYQRAGMHVALSWEFWEKELRAAGR